jgi:hypothetical protein
MKALKYVMPTNSYGLFIPTDSEERKDGDLVSYWCKDNDVLLQLSSHLRNKGEQISARNRLTARLAREGRTEAAPEALEAKECPDCAAVSVLDANGIMWIYFYGVWKDLMVFATISGKAGSLRETGMWAFDAVRSIRHAG